MKICSIDIGLNGGIYVADPQQPAMGTAFDIPTHRLVRGGKNKREVDIQGFVGLLTAQAIDHAFVEQVNAMPGQGTVSMFAFGKCYGIILGVLAALKIPVTLVLPAVWKKALAVPKAKDRARARASQLLPGAAHQWPLVKHDGRAEAALIALWGVRQLGAGNAASEKLLPVQPTTTRGMPGRMDGQRIRRPRAC